MKIPRFTANQSLTASSDYASHSQSSTPRGIRTQANGYEEDKEFVYECINTLTALEASMGTGRSTAQISQQCGYEQCMRDLLLKNNVGVEYETLTPDEEYKLINEAKQICLKMHRPFNDIGYFGLDYPSTGFVPDAFMDIGM